jgi:hypothetical protein
MQRTGWRLKCWHAVSIALLAGTLTSLTPDSALAQAVTYQPNPPGDTPAPDGFVTVPSPAVCRIGATSTGNQDLPDGGYIPKNSSIVIDTTGSVTGACDMYVFGNYYSTTRRDLDRIKHMFTPPTTLPFSYTFWGRWNPTYQTFDSRSPGNGSPSLGRDVYEEGKYNLTFQTVAFATSCQIPTDSAVTARSLNVVACEPRFLIDAQSHINYLAPLAPPNKIQVYLPSTMSGATTALQDVINSLNAVLPNSVQFDNVTSTPCGSGPSCVRITTASQLACGFTTAGAVDPNSGAIAGSIDISLRTDWNTLPYSADGLRRTFVHELLHLLGLDNANASACGVNDAAMQDTFDCTASTVMHIPKESDFLPVNDAVYGGKTRVTCGF